MRMVRKAVFTTGPLVDSLAVTFLTKSGVKLINADIATTGQLVHLAEGENLIRLRIDELYLNPGVYTIGLWLGYASGEAIDRLDSAFEIEVMPGESETEFINSATAGMIACRFQVEHDRPAEQGNSQPSAMGWR